MARIRRVPPKTSHGDAWHRARACSVCHQSYTRRNLIVVWDTRNPGHRDGWHQTTAKICLRCQSERQTQRVLVLAHIKSPPPPETKAETA